MKNVKVLSKVLVALALLGIITSVYLLMEHYSTGQSVCDINATISCSLVNSSVFSELLNVPVAIFGGLWFVVVILFSLKLSTDKKGIFASALLGWSTLGILFVIYLIIAEVILKALCPFCTVVHVLTAIILVIAVSIYRKSKKPKHLIKSLKPWIIGIAIVNLIPLIIFNLPQAMQEDHSEVAKCITNKGVNMYGSFRCGVCAKTRNMFGDAFEFINEIECHPQGENARTEYCLEKNVKGTPTWILEPNGVEEKRFEGFMTIEEMREFSGCVE
jgi:uncharacterized membrane protein